MKDKWINSYYIINFNAEMLRCIVGAQTVNIYAYDSKIATNIPRKQKKTNKKTQPHKQNQPKLNQTKQ